MNFDKWTPVDVFTKWLQYTNLSKVSEKYDNLLKTDNGRITLINDAKSGNQDCINYLYNKCVPVIVCCFYKYYVGPVKENAQKKLRNHEYTELVAEALALLNGQSGVANIWTSFDYDKLQKKDKLLNAIGQRLGQYFREVCIRYVRKEQTKNGLITYHTDKWYAKKGLDPKEERYKNLYNEVSYEAHVENLGNEYSDDGDTERKIETNLIANEFRNYLVKNTEPLFVEIWDLRSKGYLVSTIAKLLGVKTEKIKNYLQTMKNIFCEEYEC